jgi:hypothetical protein
MVVATSTTKVVWLCERCGESEGSFYYGTIARDGICVRCGGLAMEVYDGEVQKPRIATRGRPSAFTTGVALDRSRRIAWDCAGYYRDLGVAVDASRIEIRQRYLMVEGWNSDHLTYIVKQLLNRELRERYDACPPWCVWFDRYVLEAVQQRILGDLSQKVRRDSMVIDDAEQLDLGQYLDQPFDLVLDGVRSEDQDGTPSGWRWGYHLWQSRCADTARLARWQEHLVTAFAQRKEIRTIGIGFMGKHMKCPIEVNRVGSLLVLFLRDDLRPNAALAHQAADRVASLQP